ncbi:hypothetical protein N826_36755 [Skermanella aerolata KACC 11604]|nr:hypothetical protein N826_36755 [Skermanella aerolata KACC 11604]
MADFEILPGVMEACRALHNAGFLLIVATNQPDVVRGIQSREVVEAMHDVLHDLLPLREVKVCYDTDHPESSCYKPSPGMLLEAARDWSIDLSHSYMVGDRWRDVGCGKRAGCYTVFIDYGYEETLRDQPDAVCADLLEAASIILAHAKLNPLQ